MKNANIGLNRKVRHSCQSLYCFMFFEAIRREMVASVVIAVSDCATLHSLLYCTIPLQLICLTSGHGHYRTRYLLSHCTSYRLGRTLTAFIFAGLSRLGCDGASEL